MKRVSLPALVLTSLLLTSTTGKAWGKVAAPMPVPARIAMSECSFVGTVSKFEPKTVPALQYPGAKEKVEHLVAVVKVDKALAGTNGLTHVRIGFVPNNAAVGRRGSAFRYPKVGDKAMFFLKPHHSASFYQLQPYSDVIYNENKTQWTKQIAEAEKAAKTFANPMAALKSKNAEERYLAAAMMVMKYRTPPQTKFTQKPIDAKESQLILEGLGGVDWKTARPYYMNPQTMFYRLGLTPKDGWERPKEYKQFEMVAKAWIKANAQKYRLRKFEADK